MNSEAEKNPDGLNIRQELEALRDHYRSVGRVCDYYDDGGINDDIADDLTALLQRIPDGWELRPREPSEVMCSAGIHADLDAAESEEGGPAAYPEIWRAMWDAASEEKGDGLSD